MPIAYNIYSKHRLIIYKFSGLILGSEFVQKYTDMYSSNFNLIEPGFNELCIFNDDLVMDFETETLIKVAEVTQEFHKNQKTKTAFIGSKLQHRLMTNLYNSITNTYPNHPERTMFFDNPRLALEWLNPGEELESDLIAEKNFE